MHVYLFASETLHVLRSTNIFCGWCHKKHPRSFCKQLLKWSLSTLASFALYLILACFFRSHIPNEWLARLQAYSCKLVRPYKLLNGIDKQMIVLSIACWCATSLVDSPVVVFGARQATDDKSLRIGSILKGSLTKFFCIIGCIVEFQAWVSEGSDCWCSEGAESEYEMRNTLRDLLQFRFNSMSSDSLFVVHPVTRVPHTPAFGIVTPVDEIVPLFFYEHEAGGV